MENGKEISIKGIFEIVSIETRTAKKGNTYQSIQIRDFQGATFHTQVFDKGLWESAGYKELPKAGDFLYIELYEDGQFLRPALIKKPNQAQIEHYKALHGAHGATESTPEPQYNEIDARIARSTAVKAAAHLYGSYLAGLSGSVKSIDLKSVLDMADEITHYILTGERMP